MPPTTRSASKRMMPVIGRDDSVADAETSTMSAGDTTARTGFLDLPAELRNKIYHLALVENEHILVKRSGWGSNGAYRAHIAQKYSIEVVPEQHRGKYIEIGLGVAILATCRHINREATPILYGANTFAITLIRGPEMLAHLPESSRQHIRHLCLTTWHTYENRVEDQMEGIARLVVLLPNLSKLIFLAGMARLQWWDDGGRRNKWCPAYLAGRSFKVLQSIKKARQLNDEELLALLEFDPGHIIIDGHFPTRMFFYPRSDSPGYEWKEYGPRVKDELKLLLKGSQAEG